MIERQQYQSITWINLFAPEAEEIREVMDECNIPPELATDLSTPIPQTEAVAAKGAVKITLDFPTIKNNTNPNPHHEIKCIVTKNTLVTVHFEEMEAMHRFAKEFEVLATLQRAGKKTTAGHVFIALLEHLYQSTQNKLDYLESRLQDIEEQIFLEREKEMVVEISDAGRRIITFRQIFRTHEHALRNLGELLQPIFKTTLQKQLANLCHQHAFILSRIGTLSDTLDDLRDTNLALLTTKQNEIMKILTIMAFVTFPLTLFTSMFGMNTTTTPIIGIENDFWIILGVMALVTIFFFGFFKYMKWM